MEFLNPCVCCLLRPSDKSIQTPYTCLGITEIYSDMIEGCFMVQLSLGNNDQCGICEECVGRLRDARDFKLQVQRSQAELRARLERSLQARDFETTKAVMTDDETSEKLSSCEDMSVKSEADQVLNDGGSISVSQPSNAEPEAQEVKSETVNDEIGPSNAEPEAQEVKSETVNDEIEPSNTEPEAQDVKSETADDKNEPSNAESEGPEVKSESADDEIVPVPNEDPASAPSEPGSEPAQSARAMEQLAMSCSVRLERLRDDRLWPARARARDVLADSRAEPHEGDTYTCDACGKQFSRKFNLIKHIKTHMQQNITVVTHRRKHTGETLKGYEESQQQIRHKGDLSEHVTLNHADVKPFACNICGERFTELTYLSLHIQKTHKKPKFPIKVVKILKPVKCEVCNKKFARNNLLRKHLKIHSGLKPYMCDICEKCFSTKFSLIPHLRIHTGEKPYSCEYCNKKFNTKTQQTGHRRIHTGERPYKCKVCKMTFRWNGDLVKHKRIHTGEKPFSCDVCHQVFARLNTLTVHKRVHTADNPFSCEKCPQRFRFKIDLSEHVLSEHADVKLFACDICNKHFTQQRYANFHKKKMHTKQKPSANEKRNESSPGDILNDQFFLCDTCGKQFRSKFCLTQHIKKQHMEQKTQFCEICNKMFLSSSRLQIHKRIHT